ncbi:hypothetical protein FE391_25920 [Nonomuraea sp. KC401]|nr:hypothetical protein FE391_25920 [Nonomuraea sp. KC401]
MTMTLADQSALTGQDGRVTDEQPARQKRRTFTKAYKARILAAFDALPEGSPERGALLRKERLYHSHIVHWRKQAESGTLPASTGQPHKSAESFFSALKNEWLHHFVFTTRAKARRQVIRYIEGFYNRRRPPSPVSCSPSERARSTSIVINCSSLTALDTASSTTSSRSSCSTAISVIRRISLIVRSAVN